MLPDKCGQSIPATKKCTKLKLPSLAPNALPATPARLRGRFWCRCINDLRARQCWCWRDIACRQNECKTMHLRMHGFFTGKWRDFRELL